MKRVLITGVNGFIGGYLAQKLMDQGFEVHGLTQEQEAKTKGVIPHQADLRNYSLVGQVLEKVDPHFIIHLAARTEVEKSFYEQVEFSEVNYVGTVNLIEECRKLKNLELFVFASTMETYGQVYNKETVLGNDTMLHPFDEQTPQFPNAPYAVAKVGCELYLKYAGRAYGLPYAILRQTNTYGRWDNDFFVVEQFITQMLKDEGVVQFGYKDPYRNFLHIDDLISLYQALIEKPQEAQGQVFCTGPNNAIKIEELAHIIAKKVGYTGEIQWDKKPERPGEIYYLNSTNKKAKDLLGWEPQVELDEGLDRTIEIWKEKI